MEKYIALLRGINVGGKNKISMPLLKTAFEEVGFFDVSTYINSGNVLFSTSSSDENFIMNQCKAIIEERFLISIPVAIVSANALMEALNNAPKWWDAKDDSDKEVIHQAIFLVSPITAEEVFKAVGDARSEYERVESYKNIIFWSAPRETLDKTKWYKIINSSVKNSVTLRNANTAKKLLMLSNACDPKID